MSGLMMTCQSQGVAAAALTVLQRNGLCPAAASAN